jgi:GLPGLI family protein
MGKEFLVKDSLSSQWKMEAEQRVIGGYTCYKATAIKAASVLILEISDLKKKLKGAEKTDDKSASDETNYGCHRTSKEVTITAWYTPEIPVSQGPEGYWGLPGLILEVNDGKTTILCSKLS